MGGWAVCDKGSLMWWWSSRATLLTEIVWIVEKLTLFYVCLSEMINPNELNCLDWKPNVDYSVIGLKAVTCKFLSDDHYLKQDQIDH